ncbi:uncharacterized protein LOC117792691 [Drosophila innubila]|nr:uncharacterized protein LOC117792691 [Drosophila innubila]
MCPIKQMKLLCTIILEKRKLRLKTKRKNSSILKALITAQQDFQICR